MSAGATPHIFMPIYSLPLVHRPKGVLLVKLPLSLAQGRGGDPPSFSERAAKLLGEWRWNFANPMGTSFSQPLAKNDRVMSSH